MASTQAGAVSLTAGGGLISFSVFYFSNLFNGQSIGNAVTAARTAIRRASGYARQSPRLDDNGNGIPDERNLDGNLACLRYLGAAFVTGGDPPAIHSGMPDTTLSGTDRLLLWAADVSDADGISNVWCVVTPPDYDGVGGLSQVDLAWQAEAARYEAAYTNCARPGTYVFTFFAHDNRGEVSSPVQSTVTLLDSFEEDDAHLQATSCVAGTDQRHTLHTAADEDWVSFVASSNYTYDITVANVAGQIDAVLEVYRALPNGSLERLQRRDDNVSGVQEHGQLDHAADGFYYVRVASTNFTDTGSYTLSIGITPSGGPTDHVLVMGINGLTAGALPPGIAARLNTGEQLALGGQTSVKFAGKTNGTYTVTLTGVPAGWEHLAYPSAQTVRVPSAGMATFVLAPTFRVQGVVRDGLTGAWIADCPLTFRAQTGRIAGQATTAWTGTDGTLPSGPGLPCENWLLTLVKDGYASGTVALAGQALPAGSVTHVGTVRLMPVDANGDGVADDWAARHRLAGVAPTNDTDKDSMTDSEEYLSGTDPKDANSVLRSSGIGTDAGGGLTLSWPAAPGRSYAVGATADLRMENWPVAGGPWTAGPGQTNMQWSTPAPDAATRRFYRVLLQAP